MISLGDLASQFDLELAGDPGVEITGLATLASAGASEISFLSNKKYQGQLADTRAAAVILKAEFAEHCPVATLITDNPYLAFARITHLFDRSPAGDGMVHPAAVVSSEATVAAGASIGPNAVVEAGAEIGANAIIGPNVYIGANCRIGSATRIHPNVSLYHDVHVGERCILHSQSVIGGDGFGFAPGPDGWEKIYQLGGVRIGDDVEIGAGTTVDRGALEHTIIEDGVIIDNQVHVAHNCRIGKNTAIAGCTGMAGSTIIGANCTISGGVGLAGHLEVCDNVHITGMTIVTRSITEPGSYSSGTPMMKTRDWRKSAVRFSQLERIQQRLASLEKQSGR